MVVLAAIDDSERASRVADEAAKLAAAFDDELHLVHVFNRSRLVDVLEVTLDDEDPAENYEVQQEADRIAAAATADVEYPAETVVRVGDPVTNVVEYAESVDARYIVIGGRKRTPTGKALFGSVTQKVMLNADRPVVNAPGQN
ncbi:universal stress protein [Haloarchaeobius amylolyticus]|uniref:universal stress protein n=1 Tax=Haloarchaeobius amylolyticus TaxID=1198296 RepID=UPI0022707FFD|nr:universal stress protein [Haloarchaeobius amylolyticus]